MLNRWRQLVGGVIKAGRSLPLERIGVICLCLCVVSLAAVYYSKLSPLFESRNYAPVLSDEAGYYLKAKSFLANGSVRSPLLMEEHVSRVGELGAHGFMYPLVFGVVGKLVTFDNMVFLTGNLCFLIAAITLLMVFRPFSLLQRLAAVTAISSYFVVVIYMFTYMSEVLQVLLSVSATLLLVKIYLQNERHRSMSRWIAGFVGLLLVLALFRISYLLFAACLVPLARNRRQLLLYSLGFAVCFASGYLVVRNFNAAYPYGFMAKLFAHLKTDGVFGAMALVWDNFALNASRYFNEETYRLFFYIAFKYWFVGTTLYFFWQGIRRRNRLALAVAILGALNLLLLFAFYDAYSWREHRGLATVYYAFVIVLVFQKHLAMMALTGALLVMSLPGAFHRAEDKVVPEHVEAAEKLRMRSSMARAFRDLGRELDSDDEVVTVLLSRRLKNKHKTLPLLLPLKNHRGKAIRYTYNQTGPHLKRWHRIDVHYLLSRRSVDERDAVLKKKTRWFYLYKLRRPERLSPNPLSPIDTK